MRPLGVTLIGIYQILRGVLGLLFGLSLMLFTGLAAKPVNNMRLRPNKTPKAPRKIW